MSEQKYKATLSSEQNRTGWCIIFRHPVRKNPDGSPVRVRRGLGTKIQKDAQNLVDQMNEILADPSFWTPAAKAKAESLFDVRMVKAFYDQLLPVTHNTWALRNELIPLPSPDEGYARVRFLGTTGAGKTTLVRQIIGVHPSERFPSTSTAKTTVFDIEVVMADGLFKAVVTFLPREQIRLLIEECAVAAAGAHVFEVGKLSSPAASLLEHSEQRFRLSYILGTLKESDDDLSDEEDDRLTSSSSGDAPPEVTEAEQESMSAQIGKYLACIGQIAANAVTTLEHELSVSLKRLESQELDSFQELFEDEIKQREGFHSVVDEIFDSVEQRFEMLDEIGFKRDQNGWPLSWQFETAERANFIRTVNRFSSNYAPNFGKLLTPLVDGIRVSGPFKSHWLEEPDCKLVLIDGEGLGHTADSSASISTNITQRFDDIDAIVLVDSAEQPMQAAPQALLRTLAVSGHEKKLIVCFTHFDAVKGDNLPDATSKKQHVFRSLQNGIGSVREILGRAAESALNRAVAERVFFVSNIHEPIKKSARMTLSELQRLVGAIKAAALPTPPTTASPVYDIANLILCFPQAMTAFRDSWRARLHLPSRSNLAREHWTRIKALSRRFAELGSVEYDTLRPVADFILRLSERIIVFLSSPLRWEPEHSSDDMKRQVVDKIAREIFAELHSVGVQRLSQERLRDWSVAYGHRGSGSTSERARDIDEIYNEAAPIPGEVGNEGTSNFVAVLSRIVRRAVENAGGIIQ